jgi:hypothetical protein
MRHIIFVCIPITFSLVYRTGAFGWIDAVQVSKNYLSRFSSVSRFVVHGGHRSRVLSLLCFTYRTVQYSYIYCSVGRLSIELYCRYMYALLIIAPGVIFNSPRHLQQSRD